MFLTKNNTRNKSFNIKRKKKKTQPHRKGNQLLLVTVVEGDQKAPFSTATTPRCRGGCYFLVPEVSLSRAYPVVPLDSIPRAPKQNLMIPSGFLGCQYFMGMPYPC